MDIMSTPLQQFSNLDTTKKFLNIPPSNTTSDAKIGVSMDMADNYSNTQINLHKMIPLGTIPPSLVSLSSALAAAYYNYFQSPDKTDLAKDVKLWSTQVQDYIMANYSKKNPTGLAGGNVFGVTAGITGNTRG